MPLVKLHITLFLFALIGVFSKAHAQDSCTFRIEQAYLEGNLDQCLSLAAECKWTDSIKVLPIIGHAAFQLQQHAQAKNWMYSALEMEDSSFLVLQTLARLYEQEWNFPKAIKFSLLCLKRDSTNALEWYRLGITALKADLHTDALQAFAKALELNPQNFQARVKLADVLIRQKDYKQAIQLIQRGLELDSNNVLLLLQAGRTWYYLDSFELAIENYDKAQKSIDLPIKHSRIKGIAHYRLNEFEEALKYLSSALVGTDKDYIHYYMGMAFLGIEDTSSAADQFDLAIVESYAEQLPKYCDYRANLHEQSGNWKAATRLYKEASRRSADPVYLVRLANAYDRWYEDKSVAIRYLQRYIATEDKEYLNYAQERLQILKGYEHMK